MTDLPPDVVKRVARVARATRYLQPGYAALAVLNALTTADLHALLEARGEGWRTMDSAPKDKWILVWRPGSNVRDAGYFRYGGIEGWDEGRGGILEVTPTHWRPLPPPPKDSTDDR